MISKQKEIKEKVVLNATRTKLPRRTNGHDNIVKKVIDNII